MKKPGSKGYKTKPSFNRLISALLLLPLLFGYMGSADIQRVQAAEILCNGTSLDVSDALIDLKNKLYMRMGGEDTGFTGGLYSNGSNLRPAAHGTAGLEAASEIELLGADGNPSPEDGAIVMISIGMSNTYAEFNKFIDITRDDPSINPKLIFVNGAQSGETAESWVDPNAPTWQKAKVAWRRMG